MVHGAFFNEKASSSIKGIKYKRHKKFNKPLSTTLSLKPHDNDSAPLIIAAYLQHGVSQPICLFHKVSAFLPEVRLFSAIHNSLASALMSMPTMLPVRSYHFTGNHLSGILSSNPTNVGSVFTWGCVRVCAFVRVRVCVHAWCLDM